jgi:hypothetical protein
MGPVPDSVSEAYDFEFSVSFQDLDHLTLNPPSDQLSPRTTADIVSREVPATNPPRLRR